MRLAGVAAVAVAVLALAGCKADAPAPEPSTAAEMSAESPPGITLSDARVQLPPVSGRPAAAYFTLAQASGAPRKLVGVQVELAGRAEMHETAGETMKPVDEVPLKRGEALKFAPGGYHVMLFDLEPMLRFTDQVRLTALLDDGSKATAPATVSTVAEAMEHMH